MAIKATVKEQVEAVKTSAKYQVVKMHLKKNQKFYVGFGAGALVVLATRKPVVHIVNTITPAFHNTPIFNNNNTVNLGGHMTKMVKRMSDGKLWETVTEAATEAGCSLDKMSRHLNGHSPHIYEEVYKIVGVGTLA